jgi:hypothetical protein
MQLDRVLIPIARAIAREPRGIAVVYGRHYGTVPRLVEVEFHRFFFATGKAKQHVVCPA